MIYVKFITSNGEEVTRYCADLPRVDEKVVLNGLKEGNHLAFRVHSISWHERQELNEVVLETTMPILRPVVLLS